jgi:hypothetical protein
MNGAVFLKPGEPVEDLCRACKLEREHTVIVAGDESRPARVRCNYCGSEHNYRSSRRRVDERELSSLRGSNGESSAEITEEQWELMDVVRRALRQELGYTDVEITPRFQGGELVLKPGTPGTQDKSFPIDTFTSKIVMVRNRLRVLEQQINASEELSELSKLRFQAYITACYGSLTSFNFLFRNEEDRFVGQRGQKPAAQDEAGDQDEESAT